MKKIILIIVLLVVMLAAFGLDISYKIPSVLVIQSYHSGFMWSDQINKGFTENLKGKDPKIRITTEYLDTKRFNSPEYFESIEAMLIKKYTDSDIDVLVVVDNNAFNLVKKLRYSLFDDIPIVFCGVNNFQDYMINDMVDITGISENIDVPSNIKLIHQLNPNAKKLLIINDTSETGNKIQEEYNVAIRPYKNSFEVEFIRDVSFSELLSKLKNLSDDYVVLYSLFLIDGDGEHIEYDESIVKVVESTNVPVFITWDFSLGSGAVGGSLTSGYKQGNEAAELAYRILDGESADNIAIRKIVEPEIVLDWNAIQEANIDVSLLGEEVRYINKPQTFIEKNRTLIFKFSLVIFVLTIIIIILIFLTYKKMVLQRKLQSTNNDLNDLKSGLEEEVERRTQELSNERDFANKIFNNEYAIVLVINMNGKVIRVNNYTKQLLNLQGFEEKDTEFWTLIVNNEAKHVMEDYFHTKKTGSIGPTVLMRNQKGSIYSVQGSLNYTEDSSKDAYFIFNGVNVTEKELFYEKLKNQESKFRAVYDYNGISLATISHNGIVTMVNQQFVEQFGFTKEEVENKMKWSEFIHPSSLDLIKSKRNRRFDNRENRNYDSYEIKGTDKKGRVLDIMLSVVLVPSTGDVIASLADITHKNREASQQKKELLLSKAQMNQNIDFIADFCNDLVHPIENISGISSIISRQMIESEYGDMICNINDSALQMFYIIKETLNYIDGNINKNYYTDISIEKETIKSVKAVIDRLGINKINYQIAGNVPDRFRTDKFKYIKILLILITKFYKPQKNDSIIVAINYNENKKVLDLLINWTSQLETKDSDLKAINNQGGELNNLLELNRFKLNLIVCKQLIKSLGGNFEIALNNDKSPYYKFSIAESEELVNEEVAESVRNFTTIKELFNSLLEENDLAQSDVDNSNYPLKVIILNYSGVYHHVVKRMFEVLNYEVITIEYERNIEEVFSRNTFDLALIDSHPKFNNYDDLSRIRKMGNKINQPFIVSLNSFFNYNDNEIDSKKGLIDYQYDDTLSFESLAKVIKLAWKFKNSK